MEARSMATQRADGRSVQGCSGTEAVPDLEAQDPTAVLPAVSNDLLKAAQEVRDLEYMKRKTDISSPAFHVLANRVEAAARKVFRMAGHEERIGNEAPRQDRSIDDVDPDATNGMMR
jgi:hypothetical protein